MTDSPIYDQVAASHVTADLALMRVQVTAMIDALPEANAWEYPSWT